MVRRPTAHDTLPARPVGRATQSGGRRPGEPSQSPFVTPKTPIHCLPLLAISSHCGGTRAAEPEGPQSRRCHRATTWHVRATVSANGERRSVLTAGASRWAPRAERRSGLALASPGGRCRKSRSARATYRNASRSARATYPVAPSVRPRLARFRGWAAALRVRIDVARGKRTVPSPVLSPFPPTLGGTSHSHGKRAAPIPRVSRVLAIRPPAPSPRSALGGASPGPCYGSASPPGGSGGCSGR